MKMVKTYNEPGVVIALSAKEVTQLSMCQEIVFWHKDTRYRVVMEQ